MPPVGVTQQLTATALYSDGSHSLSRVPNGVDTDNNHNDFVVTNPPTPGAANQ